MMCPVSHLLALKEKINWPNVHYYSSATWLMTWGTWDGFGKGMTGKKRKGIVILKVKRGEYVMLNWQLKQRLRASFQDIIL